MMVADEAPACLRCSRPAHAREYYCPHCRAPLSAWATSLPFVDLEAQADLIVRALRAVRGGRGAALRGVSMLLAIAQPGVALIALLAFVYSAFRGHAPASRG